MLEFLSDDWLDALSESIASSGAGVARPAFALGLLVTDVPWLGGKDLRYTVLLGGATSAAGTPRVVKGSTEQADAILVTGYVDASGLAKGERTAGELFEGGGIKIAGDVSQLVGAIGLIEEIAAAAGRLRLETVVSSAAPHGPR